MFYVPFLTLSAVPEIEPPVESFHVSRRQWQDRRPATAGGGSDSRQSRVYGHSTNHRRTVRLASNIFSLRQHQIPRELVMFPVSPFNNEIINESKN